MTGRCRECFKRGKSVNKYSGLCQDCAKKVGQTGGRVSKTQRDVMMIHEGI